MLTLRDYLFEHFENQYVIILDLSAPVTKTST